MSLPRVLLNPLRLPRKGPEIGRGRAVIVIPGLTTGDISTTLLRRTLKARGFVPEGWRQGINLGADPEKMARLQARVTQLHADTGQKVVLVGWSLGGLYARVLANREAEHVDMVVTVASPIAGSRRGNSAWALYEAINDHKVDDTLLTPISPANLLCQRFPYGLLWMALSRPSVPAVERATATIACKSTRSISLSAHPETASRRSSQRWPSWTGSAARSSFPQGAGWGRMDCFRPWVAR